MADDIGSVDSDTSRFSDLTESEENLNEASRNSSLDSLSEFGSVKPEMNTKIPSGTEKEKVTQEVFDAGETKVSEPCKVTPEAVRNELIVGSEESVVSSNSLSEAASAIGVDSLISDCMKEGSENSKDGIDDTGELDLSGIDDNEINKVKLELCFHLSSLSIKLS